MIKISKQDWEKFVRDNNPEIFTEDQINFWIESNKEILLKAETDDIQDKDKKLVEDFRTELSHFTKVEVMGENPDKLQKALLHEIFYIREQQVKWDEIEKGGGDDINKARGGVYADTSLNRKLGRVGQRYGGVKKEDEDSKENKNNNSVKELRIFSHKEGGYGASAIVNNEKVSIKLSKEFLKTVSSFDEKNVREKIKEMIISEYNKDKEESSKDSNENKRFNHEGITWEVIKRDKTQSLVRAVTASVKGKEKVIDNKIIDKF